MTTFILHWWKTTTKTDSNHNFFYEMTKSQPSWSNILCIYFAREVEVWDKLFEQDKQSFSSAAPQKDFNYIKANIENFIDQLNSADVIYIRGWKSAVLLEILRWFPNFQELIKWKVVSGSSAGACVLSRYYNSGISNTQIRSWLWILPIKVFVHYSHEQNQYLEELIKYEENLPTYKIPEENFIVIED